MFYIKILVVFLAFFLPGFFLWIIIEKKEKKEETRKKKDNKPGGLILPEPKKVMCFIRGHLSLPILYTLLFGILMHIDITAGLIEDNFLLVIMAINAMILPSVLLEYRQGVEEKLKDQKRLNFHYTVLILFIFYLIGGMEMGWIERTTPESKVFQGVMEGQLKLALKPVENRLAELEAKGATRLLSPPEILELQKLKDKAKGVRESYGFGQRNAVRLGLGGTRTNKTKNTVPVRWQLCWEKLPGERGKTPKRRDCTPARITRRDSILVAEYNLSGGGKGTISASKVNGAYSGTWTDKWGAGPIYLRFTSNTSSYGWVKGNEKTETRTPATLATM